MRIDHWLLALLLGTFAGVGMSAEIVLVVGDADGVGFRDPAPANAAAGANGATTLGSQRLRVVERAAEIWATQLRSTVPIRIEVRMQAQTCSDQGTTLASAGPIDLAANFAGAPRANTSYHIAQANALAGADLSPANNDVRATFNVAIDAGCSPGAVGWWYGLDAAQPVPADRIALLPVALHEFAHGLGFSAPYDLETGAHYGDHPPVWANHLYDLQTMRHWRTMSPVERVASARNDPDLVWTGDRVSRMANSLFGDLRLTSNSARGSVGPYVDLGDAQFGPGLLILPIHGQVALVNDGVGSVTDGCQRPFANGDRLVGRITLIDRGGCTFVEKVANAQAHGAIAVVIANNVDGPPVGMSGVDPSITIPTVMISRDDGRNLRVALMRPRVDLRLDLSEVSAAVAQGCLRMFAPSALQSGSSVSHFHSRASPDLLMEPSNSRRLFDTIDLTYDLFVDIGWPMNPVVPDELPNNCIVGPLP